MSGNHRMSTYSTASSNLGGLRAIQPAAQQSTQVSTTTLLNSVHTIYTSAQAYRLDASSSLVVNTWLTATQIDQDGKTGGTADSDLAVRVWEHARRRAEDGCIVLGHVLIKMLRLGFPTNEPLGLSTPLHRRLSHHFSHQCLSLCPLHSIRP
jgi:chitin synthase